MASLDDKMAEYEANLRASIFDFSERELVLCWTHFLTGGIPLRDVSGHNP